MANCLHKPGKITLYIVVECYVVQINLTVKLTLSLCLGHIKSYEKRSIAIFFVIKR